MDIGVSSGITTIDWRAAFEKKGFTVATIAIDRVITCYVLRLHAWLAVLAEPNGHVLRIEFFGKAIQPWRRRRDYITGACLPKLALARYVRVRCAGLGIAFPIVSRNMTDPIQSSSLKGPYQLIAPQLRRCPGVTVIEDDILESTPPALVGLADVVRLANIVQHAYFSVEEIRRIVASVRVRCRDGATVIVCRNKPTSVEASILTASPGGGFALEARLGPGSEVESYFLAAT